MRAIFRPSLSRVASALRVTTERLALELAQPMAARPDWDGDTWQVARVAAVIHGVSPLLSTRLRWHGPGDWDQFLNAQRAQVAGRQQRIEQLCGQIDAALRAAGIAATALKGVALHRMGYCEPGDRPMGDIDLLVRPQDLPRVARLLTGLGYAENQTTWRHAIFHPQYMPEDSAFGEHAGLPIKIEAHTRIAERLPWTEVDIADQLPAAEPGTGLRGYRSRSALLQHLLLHAAGNMSSCWLRLLQLHDLQRVARAMGSQDWRQWLEQGAESNDVWWAYPPLRLTQRYFPGSIPDTVLSAARQQCPWLLRHAADRYTVTAVSSSSLWVRAAPAVAWSRSPVELARYLARRLVPVAREAAQISDYAGTQAWRSAGRWYEMSQGRRLVSWLLSRPARPQILHALTLALAAGGQPPAQR